MDEWRPVASLSRLRQRARMLRKIRGFMEQRDILEVETPVLSGAATTDPMLRSFQTRSSSGRLYLQTSPEFPMKRLLCAGIGPIYQIARVFRDGESGAMHNPEFTLLEWYRPGYDHHRLMDEVAELVTEALPSDRVSAPVERITYRDAFLRFAEVDPVGAGSDVLRTCADRHGVQVQGLDDSDPDAWLDLLFSHLVQPNLGQDRLCFVYDYPATQAALSRIRSGEPDVAERFELFMNGVELANGFHELTDAHEQLTRFERELEARKRAGLPAVPIDQRLIAALQEGMPNCAGVAMGFDRLLMVGSGMREIEEVIAFPIHRA